MDEFADKMDGSTLYYVAAALDPRIKTSVVKAQMSKADENTIMSRIRQYLKK